MNHFPMVKLILIIAKKKKKTIVWWQFNRWIWKSIWNHPVV